MKNENKNQLKKLRKSVEFHEKRTRKPSASSDGGDVREGSVQAPSRNFQARSGRSSREQQERHEAVTVRSSRSSVHGPTAAAAARVQRPSSVATTRRESAPHPSQEPGARFGQMNVLPPPHDAFSPTEPTTVGFISLHPFILPSLHPYILS